MTSKVLSKSELKQLRRKLPRGFRQTAVDKLKADHGREVHPTYISMVLNKTRYEEVVIKVLLDIRDEYQAKARQLKRRIRTAR